MVRDWVAEAISKLREDECSIPPTPLIELDVEIPGSILIKDESVHPTKSLKHRVARSLMQFGLCNGLIGPGTHIVEASSGSAAISEAYFAKLLGLEFTAIVPASTAKAKIDAILELGGNVETVQPGQDLVSAAGRFAERADRLFLDQFLNAERASCWRGSTNIAAELLAQFEAQGRAPPDWIVVGSGTGVGVTASSTFSLVSLAASAALAAASLVASTALSVASLVAAAASAAMSLVASVAFAAASLVASAALSAASLVASTASLVSSLISVFFSQEAKRRGSAIAGIQNLVFMVIFGWRPRFTGPYQ